MAQARLQECADLLEMHEFLTTPVRQLSLGQRMRGEVTAALLHSPELLLLDEPTIGLDVVSKERLRGFLADERTERGTTVLLATHDLSDIERLSDRIIVIDHGRLAFDGTLPALVSRVGASRVLVVDLVAAGRPARRHPEHDAAVGRGRRTAPAPRVPRGGDVCGGGDRSRYRARRAARPGDQEPAIEDVVRRLYLTPNRGSP